MVGGTVLKRIFLGTIQNKLSLSMAIAVGILLVSSTALGLDINGEGNKNGIVALYLFNNTTGPVVDSSGVGNPLNLNIQDPGRVTRAQGSLTINQATIIRSQGAGTKIINACKGTNELTVEAWLSVAEDDQNGPARIITLSQDTQVRNFTLGQTYDGTGHFDGRIRTGDNAQGSLNGLRTPGIIAEGQPHHVYLVKRGTGAKIFVDAAEQANVGNLPGGGTFNTWDDNFIFALGNEITGDRPWLGTLYMVAIFCRALEDREIQGDAAVQPSTQPVMPKVNAGISPDRERAATLYRRLVGVRVPIDHPNLDEMETLISQGQYLEAANVATSDPNFYNITVRDFAAKMSTKDETVKAPLSDFVATIIGIARDQLDARLMLQGDFTYQADPSRAAVPSRVREDILMSNNHYAQLENNGYNLGRVLRRVNGQRIVGAGGNVVDNPDPAGVLTTRAWMEAHASAGTNRRLVEYAFREFLCIPVEQWADTSAPDSHVGRDVDRFPGGDNAQYQTTCRSCHGQMDAMRGAFALVDFDDGYFKHGAVLPAGNGEGEIDRDPSGVVTKMNHNNDVFPGGYVTENANWTNFAINGANYKYFGWRGQIKGAGIKAFGTMVSNSQAFSRCMVQRVYNSVCKRDPAQEESQFILSMAEDFESNGYNLKDLFKKVAVQGACLGGE